jgi:hypothetical protein
MKSLTCLSIADTVSVVSSTSVHNKSVGPIIGANFTITVSAKIAGPSITSSSKQNSLSYGPYDFGPSGTTGTPKDSILMGPDTILNKKTHQVSISSVVPYIGTGTVSDTLIFGGGAFSDAGTTFDYSIRTKYWGKAKITYYTCPAAALATSVKNFTATRHGNYIQLQWSKDDEQNNTKYEIQISTDGKNFTSIGQADSNPATEGTTAKYQYQYDLNQATAGKLYFRVKQTDASGKVTYTAVSVVDAAGDKGPGSNALPVSIQTYPNPVTNTLLFQFNTNQTGRFLLELINTAGQIIQKKPVTLTEANQIRLDLVPTAARGLYYLRTTDLTHNQRYVTKILVN